MTAESLIYANNQPHTFNHFVSLYVIIHIYPISLPARRISSTSLHPDHYHVNQHHVGSWHHPPCCSLRMRNQSSPPQNQPKSRQWSDNAKPDAEPKAKPESLNRNDIAVKTTPSTTVLGNAIWNWHRSEVNWLFGM